MNKEDEQALLAIGGLAILAWLLSKNRGKCPRCNYPVTDKDAFCPHCGQQLDWRHFQ